MLNVLNTPTLANSHSPTLPAMMTVNGVRKATTRLIGNPNNVFLSAGGSAGFVMSADTPTSLELVVIRLAENLVTSPAMQNRPIMVLVVRGHDRIHLTLDLHLVEIDPLAFVLVLKPMSRLRLLAY